eukprot:10484012-Prorocentrum_lima.AAC.1
MHLIQLAEWQVQVRSGNSGRPKESLGTPDRDSSEPPGKALINMSLSFPPPPSAGKLYKNKG